MVSDGTYPAHGVSSVETINLVSCDRRIRTNQILTEEGKLRGITVIV
ncbi:hypothetical protein QUB47_07440 [Microcoleus sp. AT9_B5]